MTEPIALPPGITVFERGWLSANNVLFTGLGASALVDSGYCTHSAQTMALVERALACRTLDLLANTHLHSDHCGGNAALQARYPQLETLIPPGLAQHVRQWDPVALTYMPTGQQCPRFEITGVLKAGTDIVLGSRVWQVHTAPGHDAHSVILFEPDSRTLVSADALWENGFGVIFQELEGEEAFDEVAHTLDLIEKLAPRVVIPGHGPVFFDVDGSLARARRRLESFVKDPLKHARHAAKVLLKFRLLELQQSTQIDLNRWAFATPYFQLVHQRWFANIDATQWLEDLSADLVRSGAARMERDLIANA